MGSITMKYIMLSLLVMLSGCTSSTQYGKCIGNWDDENPKLVYKVSARNIALGIIFFEMVIPPVEVLINGTKCPVGNK